MYRGSMRREAGQMMRWWARKWGACSALNSLSPATSFSATIFRVSCRGQGLRLL
jgi:hypothetical protein